MSLSLQQQFGPARYANQESFLRALPKPVVPPTNRAPVLVVAPQISQRIAPPSPSLVTQPLPPPVVAPSPVLASQPLPPPVVAPSAPTFQSTDMSLILPNRSPQSSLGFTGGVRTVYNTAPTGGPVNTGPAPIGSLPSGDILGGISSIIDLIAKGRQVFSGGGGSAGGAAAAPLPPPSERSGPGGVQSSAAGAPSGVVQAGMGSTAVKVVSGLMKSINVRKVAGVVGGIAGYWVFDKLMGWAFHPGMKHRHRMNVLNPRALSRANRRIVGFSHVSRSMLRNLGYTVSSHRHVRGKAKRFGGRYKKRK